MFCIENELFYQLAILLCPVYNYCIVNVDKDFSNHSAPDVEGLPYEVQRAKEINRLFGPKGSSEAYDVIFDLHNTTSNMGSTLILESSTDLFNLQMVHYIKVRN